MKRGLLFGIFVTGCGFVVDVPDHPVVPHLLADGTCELGFGDCNQNLDNGCETDLSRDDTCGACDASCSLSKCVSVSTSPPVFACDPTELFSYPDNAETTAIPFTIQADQIYLVDDLGRAILTTTTSGGDATPAPVSSQLTRSPYNAIASTPAWLLWGETDETGGPTDAYASIGVAGLADMTPARLWQSSASHEIVAQIVVNADSAFWLVTAYNASYTMIDHAEIWSASLATLPSSAPVKLYSSVNNLSTLAATSQRLYWQEFVELANEYDFILESCAPSDCAATVGPTSELASTPVFDIGTSGDEICVYGLRDDSTGILLCGEDGATFAQTGIFPFPYDAVGLATDGASFYVADGTGDNLYATKAGADCTTTSCARVDTHGLPGFVQVSNGAAYWSSPSGIFRWSHPFAE